MFGKYVSTLLILSLAISIIAALMKLFHVNGNNYLLLVGLSSLAISAFAKNAFSRTFKGFITGLAIAWACVAVLFKLMNWSNGDLMFKSAFVVGAVWMVYAYFISEEPKSE